MQFVELAMRARAKLAELKPDPLTILTDPRAIGTIARQIRSAEITPADGEYHIVRIANFLDYDCAKAIELLHAEIEKQENHIDPGHTALEIHAQAIAKLRAGETPADIKAWAHKKANGDITPEGLRVILRSAWTEYKK